MVKEIFSRNRKLCDESWCTTLCDRRHNRVIDCEFKVAISRFIVSSLLEKMSQHRRAANVSLPCILSTKAAWYSRESFENTISYSVGTHEQKRAAKIQSKWQKTLPALDKWLDACSKHLLPLSRFPTWLSGFGISCGRAVWGVRDWPTRSCCTYSKWTLLQLVINSFGLETWTNFHCIDTVFSCLLYELGKMHRGQYFLAKHPWNEIPSFFQPDRTSPLKKKEEGRKEGATEFRESPRFRGNFKRRLIYFRGIWPPPSC